MNVKFVKMESQQDNQASMVKSKKENTSILGKRSFSQSNWFNDNNHNDNNNNNDYKWQSMNNGSKDNDMFCFEEPQSKRLKPNKFGFNGSNKHNNSNNRNNNNSNMTDWTATSDFSQSGFAFNGFSNFKGF